MITAVDTRVLLDVFGADPQFGRASAKALQRCRGEGAVVACDVVWAETLAWFTNLDEGRKTMARIQVSFSPLDRKSAETAAGIWAGYRSEGGARSRVVDHELLEGGDEATLHPPGGVHDQVGVAHHRSPGRHLGFVGSLRVDSVGCACVG